MSRISCKSCGKGHCTERQAELCRKAAEIRAQAPVPAPPAVPLTPEQRAEALGGTE